MGKCFLSGLVFLFCLSANVVVAAPLELRVLEHHPSNSIICNLPVGGGSPLGVRGQKCLSANVVVATPFSAPLELRANKHTFEHRLPIGDDATPENASPSLKGDYQKENSATTPLELQVLEHHPSNSIICNLPVGGGSPLGVRGATGKTSTNQKDTLKPRPAPDSLFLRLRPILKIERAAKFATTDPLGNFYLITPENEVQKLDSTGQVQFRFSNNRLGDITFFDASNAFNLLVFYQDFNVVQVLDRTLSESGQFNLYDAGILQPQGLTLADEKNLWVYDPDNFQLKKIDKLGATIIASQQLNLIFEETIAPTLLKEVGNEVYLMDSQNGIYVFDAFGRFLKKDPITDLFNFLPMKMKYLIFRKDKMVVRSRRDGWEQERHYPPSIRKEGKIQVAGTNLFWLKNRSMEIYSF